jgi:uncharacterized protein
MIKQHGKFVWYDVMTSDTKAAESFYRNVIGWDANDSGMTDRSCTFLSVGAMMVGGLMPIPEDARAAGARPRWMGYIGLTMSTSTRRESTRWTARFTAPPRIFPALAASPWSPIHMARGSCCSRGQVTRSRSGGARDARACRLA